MCSHPAVGRNFWHLRGPSCRRTFARLLETPSYFGASRSVPMANCGRMLGLIVQRTGLGLNECGRQLSAGCLQESGPIGADSSRLGRTDAESVVSGSVSPCELVAGLKSESTPCNHLDCLGMGDPVCKGESQKRRTFGVWNVRCSLCAPGSAVTCGAQEGEGMPARCAFRVSGVLAEDQRDSELACKEARQRAGGDA